MARLAAKQCILCDLFEKDVTADWKVRFLHVSVKLLSNMWSPGGQSGTCVSLLSQLSKCRWTDSLALFLKNLHSRFVRRLYLEHLPKGASAESDMDDAEEDNDEEGDLAGLSLPHCQISLWSKAGIMCFMCLQAISAAGPRCDAVPQRSLTVVVHTADLSVGDLDNPPMDADDKMDMDGTAILMTCLDMNA